MESEERRRMLTGVPLLAGLVEQFGADAVWEASLAALWMPANLVTHACEATAILRRLENNNPGAQS